MTRRHSISTDIMWVSARSLANLQPFRSLPSQFVSARNKCCGCAPLCILLHLWPNENDANSKESPAHALSSVHIFCLRLSRALRFCRCFVVMALFIIEAFITTGHTNERFEDGIQQLMLWFSVVHVAFFFLALVSYRVVLFSFTVRQQ